jgi:hypothetical protein
MRQHAFLVGRLAAAGASLALCGLSHAAVVGHGRLVKVTQVYVYADHGGGDVVAVLDDPIPGCEDGIWIGPGAPGYKPTLAALLMLQGNGGSARVWAHDDQMWPGSAAKFCRIYTVNPVRP